MPSNRDYVRILLKNRPCILCISVINMLVPSFPANKENAPGKLEKTETSILSLAKMNSQTVSEQLIVEQIVA